MIYIKQDTEILQDFIASFLPYCKCYRVCSQSLSIHLPRRTVYLDYSWKVLLSHPEELFGGASIQGPVGDLRLLGQVLGALDGGHHPLHGKEGRQVGRVRGDDDEGEEPPHSPDDATR